jgi:hypothetical protein
MCDRSVLAVYLNMMWDGENLLFMRIDFDNFVDMSYLLLDNMGVALLVPWCILVMEKIII